MHYQTSLLMKRFLYDEDHKPCFELPHTIIHVFPPDLLSSMNPIHISQKFLCQKYFNFGRCTEEDEQFTYGWDSN
jgi:hypothetical protein